MDELTLLGVPTAAGAYGPGQELTPSRLRARGLVAQLRDAGITVADVGDTPLVGFADDPHDPTAQNTAHVLASATAARQRLSGPLSRGAAALVLGGDCTVELGVVAAFGAANLGLLYVDLDADMNTPASADGRLDWMGVAHLLDLPGSVDALSGLGPRRPLLEPAAVRLLGTANLTPAEEASIAASAIAVETADTLRGHLAAALERTAAWAERFDVVAVHLDVDVLDFDAFPLAENTRRDVGGLTWPVLRDLIEPLCALPQTRVLTVTEVNLDHATAPDAADQLNALLVAAAERLVGRYG